VRKRRDDVTRPLVGEHCKQFVDGRKWRHRW
jgi:hypothetical protein